MEMAAVDTLNQDSRGRVWLGSAGSGLTTLAVYDPASGAATAYREAGRAGIWDIASAGGDAVWLATSTGLSHFDPVARRSRAVATPGDGGLFYSVLVDEAGLVWAGTNKGIVRFDPAGGATRRFLPVDGTGNVEFNRHAAARLLDGSLAFGGMHGVTYFRPADLVHNPHPPPVAITAARVVGRRGEADRLLPDGSVALGPGDVAVTFEFAALGFTAALQNALAYRLEGWDRDWLDAGHARSVRYTNLPPASYTFRVRAANNDGVWNREGAAVTVVVAPAFWQSWWFRLAVALLAAAAILVWHRARLARALEVERLRLRIAADLHDELGSDLSGIALAASLLGRDEALSERSRDRLARVAAAVARVTEGLRDIVWHVNPEHDTLPALEARLRGVAAAILGDLAHDVRTSGVTRPVSMDVRRHLVLIVKELLANIVRHARATRVAIRVAWAAGALRLSVADDGRGFDEANGERGAGLANIERRARAIGGSVVTETGTERGTRTIVEVPLGR
jgi:signal transduction histidine kinase